MKNKNLAILLKSMYVLIITLLVLAGVTLASYSGFTDIWEGASAPRPGGTLATGHITELKASVDWLYRGLTVDADTFVHAEYVVTDTSPNTTLTTKGYVDTVTIVDGSYNGEVYAGGGTTDYSHKEMTADCPAGTYVCGVRTQYNDNRGHTKNGIAMLWIRCCNI